MSPLGRLLLERLRHIQIYEYDPVFLEHRTKSTFLSHGTNTDAFAADNQGAKTCADYALLLSLWSEPDSCCCLEIAVREKPVKLLSACDFCWFHMDLLFHGNQGRCLYLVPTYTRITVNLLWLISCPGSCPE